MSIAKVKIQRSNPVSANIPDSKIISLSTICREGEGIALGPHLNRAGPLNWLEHF